MNFKLSNKVIIIECSVNERPNIAIFCKCNDSLKNNNHVAIVQ
jgi:hypothetical protein